VKFYGVKTPIKGIAKLNHHKIVMSDGCWLWNGCTDKDGYGVARYDGKSWRVPRLALFLFKPGEFKSGLDVLHTCNRPTCFNPNHLYSGTQVDNMQDRLKSGNNPGRNKTHCPQNHEYTAENTYTGPDGHRECRICLRLKSKLNYYRKSLSGGTKQCTQQS
jgi:hypothetical protein